MCHACMSLLYVLASAGPVKEHLKGAHDRTRYGRSRTATRSFHTHHLRLISLSIAKSISIAIGEHVDTLHSRLLDPAAS